MLLFAVGFIQPLWGQFIFNNLNEEKGLASNHVNAIMKDAEGFIWLGTRNGLCRFDGSELITFLHDPADSNTLCDNEIRTIYQGSDGLIWVGTVRGVSTFNTMNHRFKGYFHDPADPRTLSNNKVQFITGDREGNILIATDGNGLDMYDPSSNTFSHYLASDQVQSKPARFVDTFMGYVHDPTDSSVIWFGTQLGVLKFNVQERRFQHYPLEAKNAKDPSLISERENLVRDILVDEDGKLWLATWGGGLCYFDPDDGKFDIYQFEPLQPVNGYRNNIGKIGWKNEHEIWIAASHAGFGVFNTIKREYSFFTDHTTGQTLNINPSGLISDENGFLWVSSFSGGLFFTNLDAHQFNRSTIPHPLKGIAACNSNPGLIFSGIPVTYGQLIIFDQQTSHFATYNYSPFNDLSENYFQDMFCGSDRIWLIENYDLYYWDSSRKRVVQLDAFDPAGSTVSEASAIPFLISGCEAPNGEIWIGTTFHGIFRHDPADRTTENFYYPDEDAGNIYLKDFIHVLFPDSKGRIWYGSTDFGYFDPGQQRFVNFSLGKDFPESPVKSVIVRAITETQDGNIWLGTVNSGIQVIDPGETNSFIKAYMMQEGLEGSLILDLITDYRGDVWAVTDKGLSRIKPSNHQIENFGSEYGLFGISKMVLSGKDEIAIIGNRGVYRFSPDSVRLFHHEIKPYIKTFRIFDQVVSIGRQLEQSQSMDLKPNENFFSIDYGAINFFNPDQTVFSYMLEGLDESWIEAGSRKYVSYTNLAGGSYTFRLRASNGTDLYSEISLQLHIGTPFWKTVWFYVTMLFLGVVIVFGFIQYRMRHIRKQEKIKSDYDKMIGQLEMKALRAQMNPHFLFNSLNSIRYYILKEEFDNAADYLTKFSKMLRLILRNSRQNMITLADELETLSIYVEFEQMRFGKSFDFKKMIDPEVKPDDIMIQPMTIQPFIENAIWHGLMPKEDDRKLSLSISQKENMLTIVVEDNGIGRSEAKALKQDKNMGETKSYGLQITSERFELLQKARGKKSLFEITDLADSDGNAAGTRVMIHYEI